MAIRMIPRRHRLGSTFVHPRRPQSGLRKPGMKPSGGCGALEIAVSLSPSWGANYRWMLGAGLAGSASATWADRPHWFPVPSTDIQRETGAPRRPELAMSEAALSRRFIRTSALVVWRRRSRWGNRRQHRVGGGSPGNPRGIQGRRLAFHRPAYPMTANSFTMRASARLPNDPHAPPTNTAAGFGWQLPAGSDTRP